MLGSTFFDFAGSPWGRALGGHFSLGLTPVMIFGGCRPDRWMQDPIRIQIVDRTLKLVSLNSGPDSVLHSWELNRLYKVDIGLDRNRDPYLKLHFRDDSTINIYQDGLQLAGVKALRDVLRTLAHTEKDTYWTRKRSQLDLWILGRVSSEETSSGMKKRRLRTIFS